MANFKGGTYLPEPFAIKKNLFARTIAIPFLPYLATHPAKLEFTR